MNTRLPRPGTHPRTAALPRRPAHSWPVPVPCWPSPWHPRPWPRPRASRTTRPATSPAQVPPQIHTMVAGGMPGWQITLIAAGAAVLAALLAVTADRARAARRHMTAPSL